MKKYITVLALGMALLFPSCVSQHKTLRHYTPFTPDVVRLNMTMHDYRYLGEVTMEVTYKTYLGSIGKVLTINGEAYNPRYYRSTQILWDERVPMSSVMRKALYKVTDTYENADYILPVKQEKTYDHMIGGRIVKETLTVKVFALQKRSQAEMDAENERLAEEHRKAIERKDKEVSEIQQQMQDLQRRLDDANATIQQMQTRPGNRRR